MRVPTLRGRQQLRPSKATVVAGRELACSDNPGSGRLVRWPGRVFAWTAGRPSREGYALAAVVLVGFGCALAVGRYQPLALLAIAMGIGAAALCVTGSPTRAQTWTWNLTTFLGALSSGFLYASTPLGWVVPAAAGVGAVVAISAKERLERCTGALLAGGASLLLASKSFTWGHAAVDVFTFTQRATLQLLQGRDPYVLSYPTTTPHLPLAHYFYLPGVLLLSIPGRLLGDVRISDLLAAGALIAAVVVLAKRSGGSEQGWRCLALCLAMPFFPLMILYGWTEIYLITGIALWLVLRDRHRLGAVLLLGLGVATVPTALPLLLLPFAWWRRPRLEIGTAILVAIAICLPFALWSGPAHFVYASLLVNVHLPPWPTGLDLDAAFRQLTGTWLPVWVWPTVVALTLVVVVRARRHTWPNAFYLGSVFLLVALVWAKWALFNYYFLAVMGLVLAMALERVVVDVETTAEATDHNPAGSPRIASGSAAG